MSNAAPSNSKRQDWPARIPSQLQTLVAQIMGLHPFAQIELEPLPSGVCLLHVGIGDRMFVLDHSPIRGTGVSEIKDDTLPFTGHDRGFDSLDEAILNFNGLLREAAQTEPLPRQYAPVADLQPT